MDDDCGRVLRELESYLDGECEGSVRDLVSRHLGDCPPCIDRVEFARDVRALIAARCREAAPAELLDRIKGSLQFDAGS